MNIKQERENLETFSKEYLNPNNARKVDRRIEEFIVKEALGWARGPVILELGAGDGVWTKVLVKQFGNSEIVDASRKLLDKMQTVYGSRIKTYESLFEDFCPPYRYNTILASYILEHVIDPVNILKRCKSWLKGDGRVIIIVPHSGSLHRRLGVEMNIISRTDSLGPTDIEIGHKRIYNISKLERHIQKAGLRITASKGLFLKVFPNAMLDGVSDALLEGLVNLSKKMPIEFSSVLLYKCSV